MSENNNQVSASKLTWPGAALLAKRLFIAVFLLLPLAVFPFYHSLSEFVKQFILAAGVSLALIFHLINAYQKGAWTKPKTLLSFSLALVGLVALLSSLFSENIFVSFFGSGFDRDVFVVIYTLIASSFLPYFIGSKKENFLNFSFWLLLVSLLVFVCEVLFVSLANFSWFSWLANFIGLVGISWFDEATFFGLITVISLGLLEFFSTKSSRRFKILVFIALVFSLIVLAVVNYWQVWLLLAIFSGLYLILNFIRGGWIKILSLSLAVFAISLVFVFGNSNDYWLGKNVSQFQQIIKINIFEVRPNWTGTYDVVKSLPKNDLIFGVGAGRFWRAWNLYRPSEINLSDFWNTDFSYGVGYLPSMVVNYGLVGSLAWLLLLLAIIFSTVRALIYYYREPNEKNSLLIFSALIVVYLWTLLILRVPSLAILALAFVFLGWLMVMEKETGLEVQEWKIGQSNKIKELMKRLSLFFVFILGLFLIYLIVSFISLCIFWYGSVLANRGKLESASRFVSVAAWSSRIDSYERQLSEIKIAQINQLIRTASNSPKESQEKFLALFNDALKYANNATKIDDLNYRNWLAVARVYSMAVPLKIDGAEEQSLFNYQKALKLNPNNPGIWLEMANMSLSNNEIKEAKERIGEALKLKSNYLDAHFALAKIALADGQINQAIKEAESAVKSAPNDYSAWFLLGYLKYQHGDIEQAVEILSRSLQLQPNYADAKYLVGLSLDRLGRSNEALDIFQELISANPGNELLKKIIANLKAGRPAISDSASTTKETKTKK